MQKPSSTLLCARAPVVSHPRLGSSKENQLQKMPLNHENRAKMLGRNRRGLRGLKNKNKFHGTRSVMVMIGGVDVQIKFQPLCGSPQNQPRTVQLSYKKKPLHFDPLLHLIRGRRVMFSAKLSPLLGFL